MDHRTQTKNRRARQLSLLPDALWTRRAVLCGTGWWLAVTGETRLAVWADVGVGALWERYSGNERTAATMAADARRLFRYLEATGARELGDVACERVLAWCWAARPDRTGRLSAVSAATARQRQWTAFVCFEELARLGAAIEPALVVGQRILRPARQVSARPLTDGEADLARRHADTPLVTSRRPLLLAGGFGGGTATEIAALRLRDIDLDAGTVTFSGKAARTNPLDGWSVAAVQRWLHNQPEVPDADAPLCVTSGVDLFRGAQSVSVRLGDVLREAGLMGRPGVTARSFRLTTARAVLDSDGIEAAARFLGAVSLDTAAAALGHAWRDSDA